MTKSVLLFFAVVTPIIAIYQSWTDYLLPFWGYLGWLVVAISFPPFYFYPIIIPNWNLDERNYGNFCSE